MRQARNHPHRACCRTLQTCLRLLLAIAPLLCPGARAHHRIESDPSIRSRSCAIFLRRRLLGSIPQADPLERIRLDSWDESFESDRMSPGNAGVPPASAGRQGLPLRRWFRRLEARGHAVVHPDTRADRGLAGSGLSRAGARPAVGRRIPARPATIHTHPIPPRSAGSNSMESIETMDYMTFTRRPLPGEAPRAPGPSNRAPRRS